MRLLSLLSLLLCVSFSFSQNVDVANANFASKRLGNSPTSVTNGSPYLSEEFVAAKLEGYGSKIFTARYNAYNGDMEVVTALGADPIALDINNSDFKITFLKSKKTYESYEFKNNSGNKIKRFFVNVAAPENGDVSLMKREVVAFIPKVEAATSYQQDQEAKFKRIEDAYYIKVSKDAIAQKLPKSKKQISKLFPGKEKQILTFIKKNSIKTSKEEDLIKLVEFLNTSINL